MECSNESYDARPRVSADAPEYPLRSRLALRVASALVSLSVAGMAPASEPLPNGGSVQGTISSAGQTDVYTFAVDPPQSVKLRVAVTATPLSPYFDVYGPSGSLIGGGGGPLVGWFEWTAAAHGTYTVVVHDLYYTRTGAYDLYLVQIPGANEGGTPPNGGVVQDTIDRGDLDSYAFPANAGENVQLRAARTGGTLRPRVELYGPSGNLVAAHEGTTIGWISGALPVGGTYTIVVSDGAGHDRYGTYDLYFVEVPGADEGGPLPSETAVFDTIDLGDLDSFTFDAGTGDSVQLRIEDTGADAFYPRMDLYGPDGSRIASGAGEDSGIIGLQLSGDGTYTVVVSDGAGFRDHVGAYSLFLNPDCPDIDGDHVCAAADCDDSNPFCTSDCTDGDGDGRCITIDCDDSDPATYPEAVEVNDGIDNQCPGDYGHGVIDETSGLSGFHGLGDRFTFSWPPQPGATAYEVKRSTLRDFVAGCTTVQTTSAAWADFSAPTAGGIFYYLDRPTAPNVGSWGAGAGGVERDPACP